MGERGLGNREIAFTPSADVAALLNALLDRYERRAVPREPGTERASRAIKLALADLHLPAYFSQLDPEPRRFANEQLQALEGLGLLRLAWLAGEQGHLLEGIALPSPGRSGPGNEFVAPLYRLLGRAPMAGQRSRLESQLLGERFRFSGEDWRARALCIILDQLRAGKSPAPFSLADPGFNQDVLTALDALAGIREETPYRVFSVRVFNESKRFDDLKNAILRLARLGNPEWKRLPPDETLRELNLVANPGSICLSGPWELVDAGGEVLSLGGFTPAVGFPAAQAVSLHRATAYAPAVVCIENPTTFYEFIRNSKQDAPATICLMGNPSPAMRHLLRLLPGDLPLLVWADLDYGGFNILAQLRKQVDPRISPYCMDIKTLQAHAALAHPLTPADRRNLERLSHRPELCDVRPVIHFLLQTGLKLEQEAITAPAW